MVALSSLVLLAQIYFTGASITVRDPSDCYNVSSDALDNGIKANYNVPPTMYLLSPLQSTYLFNGSRSVSSMDHQTWYASNNDTNVIVIANGANLNLSYVNIIKNGYSSNLLQASFFGVNAAITVQNGSLAYFDHLNITTHNGAANIYSYGNGSYVYIENSVLYSSGPAAHGLYAGGYGTAEGKNIGHYSGGNRCSSFSGDSPAGYVTVTNAVAHTSGIGSAIFYALGTIHGTNVFGYAEKSPVLFSDGPQKTTLQNCDLTAGLLAGTVMFSSSVLRSGAALNMTDSKLTTLGSTMPGLWFGNIIATVYLSNTMINTTSGILVIANFSQVTQEFNYFAGYADNSNLSPANVMVNVMESNLRGDLVAYNGSNITWILTRYSTWSGKAYSGYGQSYISVSLDSNSTWSLTGNTALENITLANNSVSSISSNGYNITYNSASAANTWLNRSIVMLNGGGMLMPATAVRITNSTATVPYSAAHHHFQFFYMKLLLLLMLFNFFQ